MERNHIKEDEAGKVTKNESETVSLPRSFDDRLTLAEHSQNMHGAHHRILKVFRH